MITDYCKAFTFDAERRQVLLNLLEPGESDHDTARVLHEHIPGPQADVIIDQFYAYLLKFPEFSRIIIVDDIPDGFEPGGINGRRLCAFIHKTSTRFTTLGERIECC